MNGPMPGPHPRVRVMTTQGTFVLRLYPEWAPFTVANFLNLANAGYFDGNRWFRVVPDFVVQTGDQTNTGDGDPGFTIGAEENPVEQRAGIISMGMDYTKDGKPVRDSAGSQFYLTLSPQLHLDRSFTVFGEVQSGFDVLPRIVESDKMVRVEQHLGRLAVGLTPHHRAQREERVLRPLGDPPVEIARPVRAERDVDSQVIAFTHERAAVRSGRTP